MEIQIKMMSAASEVFSYKKRNPNAIHEEVFQHIADYISLKEKIPDERIKFAMIAASAKAFEMAHKNPDSSEKALLRDFINEIPAILFNLQQE